MSNSKYTEHFDIYMSCMSNHYFDSTCSDCTYNQAIVFLQKLVDSSKLNTELNNKFALWIINGGTILLIDILEIIGYKSKMLIHYNAFDFLDTVSCIKQNKSNE